MLFLLSSAHLGMSSTAEEKEKRGTGGAPVMDENFLEYAVRASLTEFVDDRVVVTLRDGRKLVGYLRSFDQYLNLVLEDTVEREIVNDKFCDVPRGLFVVRGENVETMADLSLEAEETSFRTKLREISSEEMQKLKSERPSTVDTFEGDC